MAATEIFIYGASGHGKVIADIIRNCGYAIGGWIDDRPLGGVLSWDDFCAFHPAAAVALGIGDNTARARIFHKVVEAQHPLPALIHPSAVVSESAIIAKGSVVMPLAVINADATIGQGTIINSGSIVEHDCVIDDFVHISPRTALAGGVKIGHGVHIGIGATVIQNITIAENSVVAAGSAVIYDIPPFSLAAGVPAIIKKSLYKPV